MARVLPVRGATMVRGGHGNDPRLLIDLIEKTPGADAVSPGGRFPVLEPLDMGTEMRLLPQLRINVFAEFVFETSDTGPSQRSEIRLKLLRFEDPVLSQSFFLFFAEPVPILFSTVEPVPHWPGCQPSRRHP